MSQIDQQRTIFASSCIEAAARKVGCTPQEMYLRMNRVGLVKDYIWECYETLHTESRETATEDVLEALECWEKESDKEPL